MKKVLFIFIILLFSIGFGFLVHQDAGYVLIAYNHWAIETSIWVALAAILIAFLVLKVISSIFRGTFSLNKRFKHWNLSRAHHHEEKTYQKGITHLIDGQYKKAEDFFNKLAKMQPHQLAIYLLLAITAQKQKAYDRRDTYIKQAHEKTDTKEKQIIITLARLQLDAKQYEQAIATLQRLYNNGPNDSYILHLLTQSYIALNDWKALTPLLKPIKKHKIIDKEEYTHLEKQIYIEQIKQSPIQREALEACWSHIPSALQIHPDIVTCYTQQLSAINLNDIAATLIVKALKHNWNDSLVTLYCTLPSETHEHFALAEKWIEKHPDNPYLLQGVARLAIRQKFWGKAKHYLESAINLSEDQTSHQLLGYVLDAMGDKAGALDAYRTGLSVTENLTPALTPHS